MVHDLPFDKIILHVQQPCPFSFHTETEGSIGPYDVSWRYIVDRKNKVHVPVARSSGESIWRRVCILPTSNEELSCKHIISDQSELESDNVSHLEVWLARKRAEAPEIALDYIVKGNCSAYGRRLLLLSSGCKQTGILF